MREAVLYNRRTAAWVLVLAMLLSLVAPPVVRAQDEAGDPSAEAGVGDEGEGEVGAGDAEGPGEEQEEEEESLLEQWRRTLLYGIDSQVEELLTVLADNNETRLNAEVENLLQTSLNPRLRASIFEFFTDVDADVAVDEATEILSSYRDEPAELVRSSLAYLQNGGFDLPEETVDVVRPIAADPRSGHAARAARVLGLKAGEGSVEALLAALDAATDDELRGQIILAFGDLGSPDALDPLLDIASDDGEGRLIRGYAADSLGRIGDTRALDTLKGMVSAEDAVVRGYAVSALSRFEDPAVAPTLTAALRDSVARVRQFALQGVARNGMQDAVPAVIYKAEEDPSEEVRSEAFETLVQLGGGEARRFVREFVLDADNPMADRRAAVAALIEHDLSGSTGLLEEVVEMEWEVNRSQVLGFIARELSTKEDEALAGLYDRFLTHPEPAVQIFGLRGIGTNRILRMKTRVQEKSDEGNHPAVRRNAEAVLERL